MDLRVPIAAMFVGAETGPAHNADPASGRVINSAYAELGAMVAM